ncbi:hypothetical protein HDU90_000120 [Geranomyces variabilis]|nr:hypothetical protein HDU90_000120 [Geranomyces variabilis]
MEQQYNSQLQNQQYADQQSGTDRGLFSDLGQRLNPSSSAPSSSQQHAGGDDNKNLKIGIGGVLGAVAIAGVGYLAYEVVVQQWLKHQGKTHSKETVDHFQKLQAAAPPTAVAGVTTATAAHGKEETKDKKNKKDKKEKKDHKEKKDKKHKDKKHKGDSSSSSSSSSSDSD